MLNSDKKKFAHCPTKKINIIFTTGLDSKRLKDVILQLSIIICRCYLMSTAVIINQSGNYYFN